MHPELLKARMAQSAFTVPAMVERTRLLTKSLVVLKLLKHEKHKAHDARTSGFHDANVICWIWNVYQPGRMSRKVVYICLIMFIYIYSVYVCFPATMSWRWSLLCSPWVDSFGTS